MTDEAPPTLGVVLAGGLARRLGGGDKPMRTIGGRTILDRVAARMAPQCSTLVLSINGDPTRFARFGFPVVADTVEGFAGPLAGILASLEWASKHRPDIKWVVSVAADCPFLPRDLVRRLHQARRTANAELAVAASAGQVHHVTALWNVEMRHDMRRALVDEDIRKVSLWTARHKSVIVEWTTVPLDPFFNINTIEDIAEAERLVSLED